MLNKKTKDSENVPILQSQDSTSRSPIRYVIAVMCSLARMLLYGFRMNLSIAIIAMVKPKHQSQLPASNSSAIELFEQDERIEKFDWDMQTQQIILGAFYYGYCFTPILGGWLVGKYGGSRIIVLGLLISSVMMLATPIAAKLSVGLFISTRVLDGIGQGLVLPSIYNLIVKVSEPDERSSLISIASSGMNIGAIVSGYLSARLCASAFLGGWPSTFYLSGLCGIMWCFGWCIVETYEATDHRWIPTFEKDSKSSSSQSKVYKVPFIDILKSPPVWSLIICCCGMDYGYYLLFADIPIFFERILGFEIRTTGLLTGLPNVLMFSTTIIGGFLADFLISRDILSIIMTRKIMTFMALGISSILLVSIGYISNDVTLSVIVMTIAFGVYGFIDSGASANPMDIAPIHSGLIIGLMFSISSVSGFISPTVLGALTNKNETIYQWRNAFWIVSGVQTIGLLAFLIFGSGEIQDWSKADGKPDKDLPLLLRKQESQEKNDGSIP
ncbi:sialin-like [Anneissia japonica]|uniref:sialin-like n=1 Tax=Anneissia japonica TaxID=1529436 RepID=UPI001425718A|nr:sialin-like [Anneissia japonica]XP_033103929.1 sialin-like [Anneissia japonica]